MITNYSDPFCTCGKCVVQQESYEGLGGQDDIIDCLPEYRNAVNNPCLVKVFPEATADQRQKLLEMFLQHEEHKSYEHWPWSRDDRGRLTFSELNEDLQQYGLIINVRLLRSSPDKFDVEARLCSKAGVKVTIVMNDLPKLVTANAQTTTAVLGKILEEDIICIEYGDSTKSYLRFDHRLKRFRKTDRLPKQEFSLKLYRKAYLYLRDTQKKTMPILRRHLIFAE